MEKQTKTIEVSGCHDCPFLIIGIRYPFRCHVCKIADYNLGDAYRAKTTPTDCPLKTSSITIKLKEHDTTTNTNI